MASAGTVEIDFAAETARFTSELKKVRADLKSMGTDVSAIATGLSNAGRIITGVFSAAVVGAGFRAIVKATEESEAAVTQLESALRNASSAVRLSSADFQSFAKTMQTTTTFTDEAVTGVETALLAFRSLSGDTILQATSAVLDLSTRMGTDLTSAARLVGKALEDPEKGLTALARAGVIFSKSQADIVRTLASTGEKAKAQELILAELEKRFGGAAAAARDTLGGALKGLENSFGDLFEGDRNSFKGATKSINQLTGALNDPNIKKGFDNLITAASATLSVTARLAIALTNVGVGIGNFFVNKNDLLSASQVLQQELDLRQRTLALQVKSGDFTAKQLADEKQFIETLRQRVELAKQLELRQQQAAAPSIGGGHGPLRSGPDVADFDNEAFFARMKAQNDLLDLRQRALTASISDAGRQLEEIDKQLGDGTLRLSQLEAEAAKQQADARKRFADDLLDNAVSDFDRRLRLEQEFTDRVNEEQGRRVANEQIAERQLLEVRKQAVFNSIGLLTFLVAGHDRANKAISAVYKAHALLRIFWDTRGAAMLALSTIPPPLGYAAAAAAIAFGAIQAAAVISNRAPGGGGGGRSAAFDVSATSASNTTQAAIAAPLGAQQNKQTTIQVFGWSEAAIRDLVRRMKDEIEDHDLTLIRES